jgi:hypothetical protein
MLMASASYAYSTGSSQYHRVALPKRLHGPSSHLRVSASARLEGGCHQDAVRYATRYFSFLLCGTPTRLFLRQSSYLRRLLSIVPSNAPTYPALYRQGKRRVQGSGVGSDPTIAARYDALESVNDQLTSRQCRGSAGATSLDNACREQ